MGVGDRPAQQSADDQRDEGEDAQQPDVQAVLGEPVNLKAHGHQGQLAPQGRDGGSQPQAAERRTLAQGRDVRQKIPHPDALVAPTGGPVTPASDARDATEAGPCGVISRALL